MFSDAFCFCPRPLEPGGWSGWSVWSPCSRSCGSGSTTRRRTCTAPPPSYGGTDCIGEGQERKACKIQDCCKCFLQYFPGVATAECFGQMYTKIKVMEWCWCSVCLFASFYFHFLFLNCVQKYLIFTFYGGTLTPFTFIVSCML